MFICWTLINLSTGRLIVNKASKQYSTVTTTLCRHQQIYSSLRIMTTQESCCMSLAKTYSRTHSICILSSSFSPLHSFHSLFSNFHLLCFILSALACGGCSCVMSGFAHRCYSHKHFNRISCFPDRLGLLQTGFLN